VRRQVEQICVSPDFDASPRSREFLRFIVDETLAGRGNDLTQNLLATRVFGRRDDFDFVFNPIVRIQAGRLRRSLERYYLLSGQEDPVRIELPKGTYAPEFRRVATLAAKPSPPAGGPAQREPADDWPSVSVSPFENLTRDPEQDEVGVRLTEELALELGRYRCVHVVLQGESDGNRVEPTRDQARFTLTGRLRRDSEGLLVRVRLVDRNTGQQAWSDEYRAGLHADSLSEIARVMATRVGSEQGVIVQALSAERRRRAPTALGVYDAILASYDFFFTRDPKAFAPAAEALGQAVETEPECSLAWTQLARLHLANDTFEIVQAPSSTDQAIALAHNAVRLDPSSPQARCAVAWALLAKGDLTAGRSTLEAVLASNPGSLVYLEAIGWLLTLLGDWERGPALARAAIGRNLMHLPVVAHALWVDHLRRGEYEEAYRASLELRDSGFFWRPLMRACCLGHLDRRPDAGPELAELLRLKPDFEAGGKRLIGHLIKFPDIFDRVVEGLALAGLRLV
jgi:TolB-like protein